jgi:predicted nuclease of predicted toxin-antitoxin system
MLKFLLDENVRIEVKEFLEAKGFEVEYAPKTLTNAEVTSLAKEKSMILLTHDVHFSDTLLYPPEEYAGIVLIEIPPSMLKEILSMLERLLNQVKEFSGKLVIVEIGKIRIVE